MALTRCPECDGSVSTRAEKCPHCGCPSILKNIKCPECNTDVPHRLLECSNCGCPVTKQTEVQEEAFQEENDERADRPHQKEMPEPEVKEYTYTVPRGSFARGFFKFVFAVILLSGLAFGGYYLYQQEQNTGGDIKFPLLSTRVRTGTITTCKHCNTEIKNDVRDIGVWIWEQDSYGVKRTNDYCNPCGNQMVTYRTGMRCKYCDENYNIVTRQAMRREEKRDDIRQTGYCQQCGDERVQYAVNIRCRFCNKHYKTERFSAPRRDERKHRTEKDGFCSTRCLTRATLEWGSERVGEGARSIFDGLMRGIQ